MSDNDWEGNLKSRISGITTVRRYLRTGGVYFRQDVQEKNGWHRIPATERQLIRRIDKAASKDLETIEVRMSDVIVVDYRTKKKPAA